LRPYFVLALAIAHRPEQVLAWLRVQQKEFSSIQKPTNQHN
jgi:hypothetical protein